MPPTQNTPGSDGRHPNQRLHRLRPRYDVVVGLEPALRGRPATEPFTLAAEDFGVFEFRVTKYDPAYRNAGGAYTRDEWTSVSDIGQGFGGVVLTEPNYQRVEDAYTATAVAFMQEAGVPSLAVAGLENHATVPLPFAEGSALGPTEVSGVVRRLLREEFWCRLNRQTTLRKAIHEP